jgi:SHO1 osmosensor
MSKATLPSRGLSFKLSNLTADPFALSTLSLALLSWIIAFAGSLATNINEDFPKFTWWGLVFQLLILTATFVIYGFDMLDQYKNFLTAAYSIAFVYTSNSATSLVYGSGSRKAAASAGIILLCMINIIYVFYYGSDNSTPINQWIDSFSLRGPRSSHNPFFYNQRTNTNTAHTSYLQGQGGQGGQHILSNDNSIDPSTQRYVSSTRLNGFENLSERDNTTTSHSNTPIYDLSENNGTYLSATTELSDDNTNTFGITIDDFPYTARALYSYESNPDDENEISFEKGEILKVNDINSRWWQAKRSNGDIGICPSNYVELIE